MLIGLVAEEGGEEEEERESHSKVGTLLGPTTTEDIFNLYNEVIWGLFSGTARYTKCFTRCTETDKSKNQPAVLVSAKYCCRLQHACVNIFAP